MKKLIFLALLITVPCFGQGAPPTTLLPGTVGNTGGLALLGGYSVTTSGSTYTLAPNEWWHQGLNIAGTATTIVAPKNIGQAYDVTNSESGSITFGGSTGITVTIAAGTTVRVKCSDGANYVQVGASGGAVSSVSNSDGSLTVTPTTGAVVASLNPAHANTWTATQTFSGAGNPIAVPVSEAPTTESGFTAFGTDPSGNVLLNKNGMAAEVCDTTNGSCGNFIQPETFGAVGYLTISAAVAGTDSTSAIQSAINAAAVKGEQVLLQCAIYKTTGVLTITTSNTGIHGLCYGDLVNGTPSTAPIPSTILSTSGSADILDVTGSAGPTVVWNKLDNFSVQRYAAPTGSAAGINLTNVGGTVIDRVFSGDSICDFKFSGGNPGLALGIIRNSGAENGQVYTGYTADTVEWCDLGNNPSLYFINVVGANSFAGHTGNSGGINITGTNTRDVNFINYADAGNTSSILIDATGSDKADDIHFFNTVLDGYDASDAAIVVENTPCQSDDGGGSISFIDGHISGTGLAIHLKSACGVNIGPMVTDCCSGASLVVDNSLGPVSRQNNIHDMTVADTGVATQWTITGSQNSIFHNNIFRNGGSTAAISMVDGLFNVIDGNTFENSTIGIEVDPTSGRNSITNNTGDSATVPTCVSDPSVTDLIIDPCTGNAQYPGTVTTGTGVIPALTGFWKICGDTASSSACTPSSSTSVRDSSGNAYTGTWTGTQGGTSNWYSAAVSEPYAGFFDGSTNYITTGWTPSSVTGFTIVAREYTSANITEQTLLGNYDGTNGIIMYAVNNPLPPAGNLFFNFVMFSSGSASAVQGAALLPLNQWNCVVGTHAAGSSTLYLYINGTLTGTQTLSAVTDPPNGSVFTIGKDSTGTNHFWQGLIGDVRVYPAVVPGGSIPGCI